MDVKSAYLNGELKEEIYMRQPEGFVAEGKERMVCRLNKSLYGLKQAGRTWNERIDGVLKTKGFVPIPCDPCIYAYRRGSVIVIITLYVDDLLLASDSLTQLEQVKAELSTCFDMEDLGEAHFVLGVEITRNRKMRTLTISQGAYVTDVIERFGMGDCHPLTTPMEKGGRPRKAGPGNDAASLDEQGEKRKAGPGNDAALLDEEGKKRYQSAVGALLYAAQCTRPDISFAVTVLSQFNSKPTTEHWSAVKRVLRYLRGSVDRGITYRGSGSPMEQPILHGYSDADYAEDKNDRRSFTGYAFLLSGAAVSWASRKQTCVATSSTESEYMAVSDAAKEAIWWRSFLSSLGYDTTAATCIWSDNQGSIALSENPVHHKRTKHIDVRHHYIREKVQEGTIALEYIHTSKMAADVLTKPLQRIQLDITSKLLGMTTPA
jgi:hypothetical protein